MDRTITPKVNLLDKIPLQEAGKIELVPGINAYLIEGGKKDLVKVQTFFNAGRWHEPQKLVAQITARMLKEGTANYNAKTLAEKIDYYGATISTKGHFDFANVTVYTMQKFLNEVMQVNREVIEASIFPKKELGILLNNSKQRLSVNKEKTTYLASTRFYKLVFGEQHPYGYDVENADYDKLSADKLKAFYQDNFINGVKPVVYISGKFNDKDLQQVAASFDGLFNQSGQGNALNENTAAYEYKAQSSVINKKDALQAAIRIGKPIIGKNHPDRLTLNILNIVLGGYFGSRLMNNIREEKGYTYSIYSTISSYLNGTYFLISTEVGSEVCDEAIKEIYFELERLQSELIGEKELQLVKNYISGSLLRMIDGPFKKDSILKGLYDFDLDTRYFQDYVDKVKSITSAELQQCAQKYFNKETLTQVVARN